MSITNDVSGVYSDLGLTRPADSQAKKDLGQKEFLDLMMAQMKNQDPFKPLESGEFLTQIAQFGTASGVQELQASFESLANSLYSNQALQASALVGRTGLVPGGGGELPVGGGLTGAVNLPAGTDNLTLTITDGAGQIVRKMNMGIQAGGLVDFSWDGLKDDGTQAAPGVYGVTAEANLSGQATGVQTLIAGRIESVDLGRGALTLNMTGLGPVAFGSIKQIR